MCRRWSLLRPFGGACLCGVALERHVELVAVAAVARDDVLQRLAGGCGHAAEDQQRGVERGVETAGGCRVGGLAPQRLLGAVDGVAVAGAEDVVQRATEVLPVEAGQEVTRVPAV